MSKHKEKLYALSDIAINEGDKESFKQNKDLITNYSVCLF